MNEQAALDELFGMMKIAKTQQEAVQAALDGLAAERAALAKERATHAAALAQQIEAVKNVAGGVSAVTASLQQATSEAIPALQKAAGEAVGASVRQSLAGAVGNGRQGAERRLRACSQPLVGCRRVSGRGRRCPQERGPVVRVEVGAGRCRRAGGRVPGRLCRARLAVAPGQRFARGKDRATGRYRADADQRGGAAEEGGLLVMTTCGGRLCIEASSNQGPGAEQWTGSNWSNKETSVQLVIPRGY